MMTTIKHNSKSRLLPLLLVLALALIVRALTANFIASHITDPNWFQTVYYEYVSQRAQHVLEGTEPGFLIDDSSRTDLLMLPPGYYYWVASIYQLTGVRSALAVQTVQWCLDALSILLLVGIGNTAYGWRTGIATGLLSALSPLLALYGVIPFLDSPTSWLVLSGVWMLLLSVKSKSLWWALGAGLMIGLSCWFRANALLLPFFWAIALLIPLVRIGRLVGARLALAILCTTALAISPIIVRNARTFKTFIPSRLGVGLLLWQGIGVTERAEEFGAVCCDGPVVEQERAELGLPPDSTLFWPDGIQRDRYRKDKALSVIKAHPVWYGGVMLRRMAGLLKFAGEPVPFMGSAGINVTSKKSLPAERQHGPVAVLVNFLGMVQSVLRYIALPLMLFGITMALKTDWRRSSLILATIFYYLITLSMMRAEIRFGLPMQALLMIFAGLGVVHLAQFIKTSVVRPQKL